MAAPAKKVATPMVRKLMSSTKVGVVVSAGKMDRAVKVRIAKQEWNKKFRKHFPSPETHIVADPQNSLVEGDVVRIASGWRTSKTIRHVVTAIVAPFGAPVQDRPPVLTDEQRMELRIKERILKDVRSAAKGRSTSEQRLVQARKQGYEIPSLEEAMKNVKLAEEEERRRKESGGSKANKLGVVGNVKQEVKKAREAGRKLKEARLQKS
ncbi:nucleic acid-binding protein [Byssothecium circinans]|uniref:Nucleic acid-binding protein n=1 Tax=Byssothecium circinans TaxID=147558 RepID=A0A6A5UGU3_9PLEO|nr:nucleic acid-binding protein [Byssothecium circinans]